jgi:molybdopterin-guanine dinucleotide biosynthesis protein A
MRQIGLIYAGGAGTRLGGVDKAAIVIGGITLERRARAHLAPCDEILLSTGPHGASDSHALPDDPGDPPGPVAALNVALRWWLGQGRPPAILLTVAVDAPGLPKTYAETMLEGAHRHGAVHAHCAGMDHPTHAAFRFDLLEQALAERPKSPKAALALMNSVPLDFADAPSQPFRSVNTPDDLVHWRAWFGDVIEASKSGLGKPGGVR